MTHSPGVRVLVVNGGVQRSEKACGSHSPHGYYGIDGQVVGAISNWIEAITAHWWRALRQAAGQAPISSLTL